MMSFKEKKMLYRLSEHTFVSRGCDSSRFAQLQRRSEAGQTYRTTIQTPPTIRDLVQKQKWWEQN